MVNEKINIQTLTPVAQQLLDEISKIEGTKGTKDTINKIIEQHAEEHYGIKPALLIKTKEGIAPLNSVPGDKIKPLDSVDSIYEELIKDLNRNMKYKQIKQLMKYLDDNNNGHNNSELNSKDLIKQLQEMIMINKLLKSMKFDDEEDKKKNDKYIEVLLRKIEALERKIEKKEEESKIERLERMIAELERKLMEKNNDNGGITARDLLALYANRDKQIEELTNRMNEERRQFLEEKLMKMMDEWRNDLRAIQMGNQEKLVEMINTIRAIKEISGELGLNKQENKSDLKSIIGDLLGKTIQTLGEISKSQHMKQQLQSMQQEYIQPQPPQQNVIQQSNIPENYPEELTKVDIVPEEVDEPKRRRTTFK